MRQARHLHPNSLNFYDMDKYKTPHDLYASQKESAQVTYQLGYDNPNTVFSDINDWSFKKKFEDYFPPNTFFYKWPYSSGQAQEANPDIYSPIIVPGTSVLEQERDGSNKKRKQSKVNKNDNSDYPKTFFANGGYTVIRKKENTTKRVINDYTRKVLPPIILTA